MATATSRTVSRHHAAGAASGAIAAPGDDMLLEEFLQADPAQAEKAFKALMVRHGPMVMGVCRHVLHHDQDAEDAFQATFLTLARKADTIRDPRVLGGWLYEVAYRIAVRSRANTVRRRDQERQGVAMSATTFQPDHENQAAWNELRPVLHDEVNRLPEKYRLPVILSYLEGKSNEEVAELLEWPVGTVKGRLSRARDLLRSRLTRKGLTLGAAFLVAAISRGTVFAEPVPASLIERTAAMALHIRRAGLASEGLRNRSNRRDDDEPSPPDEDPDLQSDPESRRRPRRRRLRILPAFTTEAMVPLIALLAVLFAIATFIGSDPVLSARLWDKASLIAHGQWVRTCGDPGDR